MEKTPNQLFPQNILNNNPKKHKLLHWGCTGPNKLFASCFPSKSNESAHGPDLESDRMKA